MPKAPTVVVEGPTDAKRAVSMDPTAIQEHYCAVPADINRWGQIRAEAKAKADAAELALDVWEARTREAIVKGAESRGEKKPSEDRIDSMVYSDPDWERLKGDHIRLVEDRDRAAETLAALHAKKEMLVSLGADLRQERETEIRINERKNQPR